MDASALRLLFFAAFAAGLLIEIGLDFLNRREILRNPVLPVRYARPPFAGRITPEAYARSRAYSLERLGFGGIARFWSAAFTLALLFSGVLPWFDRVLEAVCGDGLSRGVFFLAGIAAASTLLQLPFSAWSTFRIEGKYGFNTMTWGLFWRDAARELMLAAALGLPVLYALMAFFRYAGGSWWLWAFAAALAYQAILMLVYPAFIAPLFNRFAPLPEGDLKRDLIDLAERTRFSASGIFVMDGSRRSLHSNAYFTGFGRFRRIVLFDTLLRQMEPKEIISVLAHEIGHYKLKHIPKLMAAQAFMLGATLALAALALRLPSLYQAFGFAAPTPAGAAQAFAGPPAPGLYLFFTVFAALGPLFAPFRNALSRRHEYQADAFAVKTTGDAASMQSGLIKLSGQNLSNLTPHPWYSAFHYSHPTVSERVTAIEAAGSLPGP